MAQHTLCVPHPAHLCVPFSDTLHPLHPLDVVLGFLADELDALQYIGDVVDTTFLDLQHLSSPVQIHNTVGRLIQQTDEFFGEQPQ